jgi:hypothetical protein
MRFVPFTFALALGNLNRVYFGFRDHGLFITTVPYNELWLQMKSTIESLSKFIDSISASFCCGTLPPLLEIKGLVCLQFQDMGMGSPCGVCHRAEIMSELSC